MLILTKTAKTTRRVEKNVLSPTKYTWNILTFILQNRSHVKPQNKSQYI